ncbi:flippase [Brevundimonas sp. Root1423]|uniref:flippase n=1 Tax=Brevundimonas sp. Root1423 TaxID=1736462 RepID=UPI00138F3D95|nr:flippase [Brevundimonas sp. Root1423]
MLGGRDGRVLRNLVWTLAGTGLPMLAALIAVPVLIQGIGLTRFGVLSIAWIVVGYFSLFDMGLGRALSQIVARRFGRGERTEVGELLWTATVMLSVLGVVMAAVLAACSAWIVQTRLNIPADLWSETIAAFYLLATTIPLVMLTSALRGVLEGDQRFGIVNAIRVPLGVFAYAGPLLVLPFTSNLAWLISALVVVRIAALAAHISACGVLYADIWKARSLSWAASKELIVFGGWMTVSNIVGPLLLYLGRFAIAVLVSVAAVPFFSTIYDVSINLLVIPGAIASVMFPVFAATLDHKIDTAPQAYHRSLFWVALIMAPLCALAFVAMKPAVSLWISPDFAEQSFRVGQVLAIGIFINAFGHVSQAFIQARGRPDLTAKLHLAELALYLPYMYWLTVEYGVVGAAIAWAVRVTISTVALALIARWTIKTHAASRLA